VFLDLLRRKRSAAIVRAPACLHYKRPQKHLDFDEERDLDRELEAKLSLSKEMADHLAENAGPTAVMWILTYWSRETPILSRAGKPTQARCLVLPAARRPSIDSSGSESSAAQPVTKCKFARCCSQKHA
jgi:hypothetical protein